MNELQNADLEIELQKLKDENTSLKLVVEEGQRELMMVSEELKQTHLQMEAMFESNKAIIIIIHSEICKILNANNSALEFYGYSKSELCNFKFQDLCLLDDIQVVKHLQEAQNFENNSLILEQKLSNGLIKTVEMYATPTRVFNNDILFCFVIDISEKRKAELTIIENEHKFRTVADFTYDWEYWISPEQKIIYMSPSCERISGYKIEEFIENPELIKKIIHPDDFNLMNEHFAIAHDLENHENIEQIGEIDFRIIKKNGDTVYIGHICRPVFDDNGNYLGRRVSNRNITDRKLAEADFEEIKEKYLGLSEASYESVFFSEKGVCIEQNKAAEKMFGYTLDEALGRMGTEWIVPEDRELVMKNMMTGHEEPYEARALRKDGTIFPCLLRGKMTNYKGKSVRVTSLVDITELKRAQDLLIEREINYTGLFNSVKQSIYIQNPDLTFIDVNQGAIEMYGYEREFFIGKSPAVLAAPGKNDIDKVAELVQLAYNGFPQKYEFWGMRKDGTIFPKDVWTVKSNYQGKDILFTLANDITDRYNTEQALIESEERYRNIFINAPIGIYRTTYEGKVILANPKLLELLGFESLQDLQNRNINDDGYDNSEDRKVFIGIIEDKGYVENYEAKWKRKDGSYIHVNEYAYVVYDNDGNVLYYEGTVNDLTDRKKAEEELQLTLQENSALLEAIPDMFFVQNHEGIYLKYHAPNDNLLYYPPEIFLNKSIFEVLPKYLALQFSEIFNKAIETKQIQFYEYSMPINNETMYFEARILAYMDDRILSIVRDITDRKNSESQLISKNHEIEAQYEEYMQLNDVLRQTNFDLEIALEKSSESESLKTAFLQNMSHEIRTPLNGILGFANLLNNENISKDEIKLYTNIINQSGGRLSDIINNVLELSKIETGQITIKKQLFSPDSILNDLNGFFKPIANDHSISLNMVETGTKDLIIDSDESKIFQIMNNLINNAIKFTKNGKIDFGYYLNDENIVFYVKDSGVGISKEYQERIFDRFSQIDLSITRGFEGAGLGLAICKGLTEALGGRIWVESEIGIGSAFFVEISSAVTNMKPKIESVSIDSFIELNQKKVLIVDDDDNSIKYLSIILNNSNCSVLVAKNGEIALEIVQNNPDIDLVLMDIKMPVMGGFEATKEIKKIRPDLPIIAQTAYAFNEEKKQILAAGCNDYIAKPIPMNRLIDILKKYIQ